MNVISAQVALYPLGEADLGAAIEAFLQVLEEHEVTYRLGSMSTLVWGEAEAVFAALEAAYLEVTRGRAAVMNLTLSNACPLPSASEGGPDA